PTAAGHIVNHSSKASVYTVHVKFKDASGNGVGDGITAGARGDAGTAANRDLTGRPPAKGHATCSLGNVHRKGWPQRGRRPLSSSPSRVWCNRCARRVR